jgi:hypothetical protein
VSGRVLLFTFDVYCDTLDTLRDAADLGDCDTLVTLALMIAALPATFSTLAANLGEEGVEPFASNPLLAPLAKLGPGEVAAAPGALRTGSPPPRA